MHFMALPSHRTFAKNRLGNNLGVNGAHGSVPHRNALPEIEAFSKQVVGLLPHVIVADPTIERESSHALLDLLSWLVDTVFQNALRRYPPVIQRETAWVDADNAVLQLRNDIQDMAARHRPVPYVANPGPEAPIESALELIYTSILSRVEPSDFSTSFLNFTPLHAYTSIRCNITYTMPCLRFFMYYWSYCTSIPLLL